MSIGWFEDFVAWRRENRKLRDLEAFRSWFSGVFVEDKEFVPDDDLDKKVAFRCQEPRCDFFVKDSSTDKGARAIYMHLTDPMEHVYQIVFEDCGLIDNYTVKKVRQIRNFVLRGIRCKQERAMFESLRKSFEKQGFVPKRKREPEDSKETFKKRKALLNFTNPFSECFYEPGPLHDLFPDLLEF